jgi:hypothetical protein
MREIISAEKEDGALHSEHINISPILEFVHKNAKNEFHFCSKFDAPSRCEYDCVPRWSGRISTSCERPFGRRGLNRRGRCGSDVGVGVGRGPEVSRMSIGSVTKLMKSMRYKVKSRAQVTHHPRITDVVRISADIAREGYQSRVSRKEN